MPSRPSLSPLHDVRPRFLLGVALVTALVFLACYVSSSQANESDSEETQLRFDMDGGAGLALQPSSSQEGPSNLVVVEEDGGIEEAVVSGSATIQQFLIAPNDKVYVLFEGKVDLNDTSSFSENGCLLAEVDPETGVPHCIDDTLVGVFWDDVLATNPAVQFDGSGAIYYLGWTSDNTTVLRRYQGDSFTNLITDQVHVQDFLVLPDGSVFVSGQTTATEARWVRRVMPTGGLQSLRATGSHFLRVFADGNVYMGLWDPGNWGVRRYLTTTNQVDSKYWISGSINHELDPDTHFRTEDFCSGSDSIQREAFCGSFGMQIKRSFGGYVIAGNKHSAEGVFAQYYPDLQFPATAVRKVSVAVGTRNSIILAGMNSADQHVLTSFHPSDGTETQLIGPSNEIEIYHLNYLADKNKLMFDGLRFADNRYVLGEIDLGSPQSSSGTLLNTGQVATTLAGSASQVGTTPTGSTKWEDFQTFGEETIPPPLPPRSADEPSVDEPSVDEPSTRDLMRARIPAKLQINQVQVRNKRLIIRGSIDRAAAGERLAISFRARGRQIVMRPVVRPNGRIAVNRRLRGAQQHARVGQLRVRYTGNETLRAVRERLRAARWPVRLRIGRLLRRENRLALVGRVHPRAGHQVLIQVEFNRLNGAPVHLASRARVNRQGVFRTQMRTPLPVRSRGAWVSVTHPGRGLLSGQRRGRSVGR